MSPVDPYHTHRIRAWLERNGDGAAIVLCLIALVIMESLRP